MEQLIFLAVIVLLSVVESVAKSRRQRGQRGPADFPDAPGEVEPTPPPGRRRPAQRPPTSLPPTYDEDASFDARIPREEGRSLEAEISYDQAAAAEAERRRREASSESMIPGDIWEEIARLGREAKVERPKPRPASGQQAQRRPPQPRRPAAEPPSRPRPALPQRAPAAPARRAEAAGTAEHPVHLSHAGFGTDPSERAAAAQGALRPLEPAVHADAAAVRAQLRGHGVRALRQAVILQEILGPPVASRSD